jgi:hypothetical protein
MIANFRPKNLAFIDRFRSTAIFVFLPAAAFRNDALTGAFRFPYHK